MRTSFNLLLLICAVQSFGQEYLDKKIIIHVSDTSGIYQRVRIAFGKNDFMIKEDGNTTIITTFPRELKRIPGYVVARAEITGDIITITGIYGLARIDDWGYTRTPNQYKNIMYMKGSKTWPILMRVASELGTEINFSK